MSGVPLCVNPSAFRFSPFVFGLALATALAGAVDAQSFPSRNLRFVGIATPGTTSDVIGRTVGEPLSRQIGQAIVVENRAGAGGTLAAGAVARSEPDGH